MSPVTAPPAVKLRKAVFPVAGLGTRFLPATKAVPKELFPVYDRPAIELVLDEALSSGIDEILFITGRHKVALTEHFDRHPELEHLLESKGKRGLLDRITRYANVRVHSSRQKEALGLGHAVLCAEAFVGHEPFAVFLPDDIIHAGAGQKPAAAQMLDVFKETGSSVIALEAVPWERVERYGVVGGATVRKGLHKLDVMVEKPARKDAPTNLTVVGRYVFTPGIFDCLHHTARGRGGEIQLTDAIAMLVKKESVYGLEFEGRRYDTGEPPGFLEAMIEYALRSPDAETVREYLKRIAAEKS